MSDTPETDDLARGNHVVPTEWAEQLEIERNKAREELEEYRSIAENIGAYKAVSEKEKAIRERDEMMEELQKLEGAYADATNYYARMIELREELDETRKEVKYWQELYRTVSVY